MKHSVVIVYIVDTYTHTNQPLLETLIKGY